MSCLSDGAIAPKKKINLLVVESREDEEESEI